MIVGEQSVHRVNYDSKKKTIRNPNGVANVRIFSVLFNKINVYQYFRFMVRGDSGLVQMLENPQHGLFYVGQYMFIQKKGRVGHIVQHDIVHQQG